MTARAELRFWTLGSQYYIAGRSAVFCKLVRIYGNIYHHTIETLLKAGLSREISLSDLKDQKKFGHDLHKLWPAFKAQFHWADLDRFDPTIEDLHHFEEIRYPDKTLKHGAIIQVKPDSAVGTQASSSRYEVNKHELDHLVLAIFETCRVIPARYFSKLAGLTHEMLMHDNPVADQLLAASLKPIGSITSPP